MPSLMMQKRLDSNKGESIGQVHKYNSDMVIESTWWNDLETRTCYLYDYWHDDYKTQMTDLHPEKDHNKIPISLKFMQYSSQTYSKDWVTFHIQMKPSQKCNVPYYEEFFHNRYNAIFPVGMYLDIPDEKGKYNRWLCVAPANYHGPQFPTYEVLPCARTLDWIYKGKKIRMACVPRSQNSYNSGVWTDYHVTSPEDQQKILVPLNELSEKIFYDKRFLIDAKVDVLNGAEPRTWIVTKVNRIQANGVVLLTLAQDRYNPHTDYVEYDDPTDPSTIQGMYADYFEDGIKPSDDSEEQQGTIIATISYSGSKNEMRIGGSYKKYAVTFESVYGEVKPYQTGQWTFTVNGKDVSPLITVLTSNDSSDVQINEIKAKFANDDEYIGEVLTVGFESSTGVKAYHEVPLTI